MDAPRSGTEIVTPEPGPEADFVKVINDNALTAGSERNDPRDSVHGHIGIGRGQVGHAQAMWSSPTPSTRSNRSGGMTEPK